MRFCFAFDRFDDNRTGANPPAWSTSLLLLLFVVALVGIRTARARQNGTPYSSRNIEFVSHHPLGGTLAVTGETTGGFEALGRRTGDLTIEQDENRPFVYVARRFNPSGFTALDLSTPSEPDILYEWNFASNHDGVGATDITHFKANDRYYVVLGVQFTKDDPDSELAAIVFDVTEIASGKVKESARIRRVGGYHHLFAYRHSNNITLLFGAGGGTLDGFDVQSLLSGNTTPVFEIEIPEEIPNVDYGFHDMQAAYHVESEVDRLYTSGAGGYYVYDISDPINPSLIATVSSAAIQIGHGISPIPDGSLIVTTAGYRASPLRIFDIQPAFGESPVQIRTALGAWVANWKNQTENMAVRWPFVFAASMEDGFQVINIRNPLEPYTAGYYLTWAGKSSAVSDAATERTGAWDIDVRNSDGLIVVTDSNTGLWAFRMDGFQGWDGRGWGYPNISTVQNWENGPVHSSTWPAGEDFQP